MNDHKLELLELFVGAQSGYFNTAPQIATKAARSG
jgi:hypothetical protein